ncbi:MAG: hypothetical protein CM15mV118_150 [uncultured marine virus]|nr:MAG: hypothetical protein CM15mV118_150 [uncultured marine virus]
MREFKRKNYLSESRKKGKISQTSYRYSFESSWFKEKELIYENPGKRPIDHQMFVDKDGLKKVALK